MRQNAQFSKSKIPYLVRHRGGKYYASAKVAGKVIRRSLDTDDFNVAKNRQRAALAEIKGARNASNAASLGIAIQEEAICDTNAFATCLWHRLNLAMKSIQELLLPSTGAVQVRI